MIKLKFNFNMDLADISTIDFAFAENFNELEIDPFLEKQFPRDGVYEGKSITISLTEEESELFPDKFYALGVVNFVDNSSIKSYAYKVKNASNAFSVNLNSSNDVITLDFYMNSINMNNYYTKEQINNILLDLGNNISATIDNTTYIMTFNLKHDNETLATTTIDLPLESVVVNGSYNNQTKKVILTLENGNTIEFSVADLVSGLQTEITQQNKLNADLITDGTTNKTVTATEKNIWYGKQGTISASNKVNADYIDDSQSTNKFTNASEKQVWNDKQNALIVGDGIDITSDTVSVSLSGASNILGFTDKKLWASGTAIANDTAFQATLPYISEVRRRLLETYGDYNFQTKIDSTHKLSADLLTDGTTNKPSVWNNKQDALTPGQNITISNNIISANLSAIAGNGISITGGNIIAANISSIWSSIARHTNFASDLQNYSAFSHLAQNSSFLTKLLDVSTGTFLPEIESSYLFMEAFVNTDAFKATLVSCAAWRGLAQNYSFTNNLSGTLTSGAVWSNLTQNPSFINNLPVKSYSLISTINPVTAGIGYNIPLATLISSKYTHCRLATNVTSYNGSFYLYPYLSFGTSKVKLPSLDSSSLNSLGVLSNLKIILDLNYEEAKYEAFITCGDGLSKVHSESIALKPFVLNDMRSIINLYIEQCSYPSGAPAWSVYAF